MAPRLCDTVTSRWVSIEKWPIKQRPQQLAFDVAKHGNTLHTPYAFPTPRVHMFLLLEETHPMLHKQSGGQLKRTNPMLAGRGLNMCKSDLSTALTQSAPAL